MQAHVSGKAGVSAPAPTLHVGTYRRALLSVIIGNDLFTDAEQVLTNHNAHECADAARLALWTKNARRVAAERQAQRNVQTLAGMEQAIERFNQRVADKATAPAESTTPAPAYATEAQCAEVARLAAKLSCREQRDALRRLPHLTEPEAAAFIRGLHLRRGPRLRVPVTLAGQVVQFLIAERHYEGAKVDYVQELGTNNVLPARQVMWRGPLVHRVWAN